MKRASIILIFFTVLLSGQLLKTVDRSMLYRLSDNEYYSYNKPNWGTPFSNVPVDFVKFYEIGFTKKNIPAMVLIGVSTAFMIINDEDILVSVQEFSEDIGLDRENNLKTLISIDGKNIFRAPTDLSSSLYYIGDGWLHISIAASFLTYGSITSDNRALQTASQLAEGLMTTGITTQFLKHITGRESPSVRTRDGGRWIPFPNQIDYHENVPHYDAYPSGHLATAMMTYTVIHENYPEYKFIKPLSYIAMGLLSYQMINNGVHWISDYPLSIGIGYLFGKIAVDRGRRSVAANEINGRKVENEAHYGIKLFPYLSPYGDLGITATYSLH
ncbi:MAG: phosphatase PAP2 family protein [Candidatus Delongbacteria bacterium]|nr:phosphatase PAP2 family protein [Candidatus Delongbacteria bacterium]